MYGTFTQDLAVLGCSEVSTWDDVRAAYRAIARHLHGELQRKTPGSNERLVNLNVAYERLAGSWAPKPKARSGPAHPETAITCGPEWKARLQTALRKAAFKAAFEAARDPDTGNYGDPRRLQKKSAPATFMVVKAVRDGFDLQLYVDRPLQTGRILLAVPEIIWRRNGGIEFGSTGRVIAFSLPRNARRVQVDSARLQFGGDTAANCAIYQP